MDRKTRQQRAGVLALAILLAVVLALPGLAWAAPFEVPHADTFELEVTVVGVLPPGTLGLPGEPITWIVTVTNRGTTSGADLVIRDVLRDELRIDTVEVERGWQSVNGQTVEFSIPTLEPGETVGMQIVTTVLRGPADGLLTNQVQMQAQGPSGVVQKEAVAELYVPTGLPATGYPPEEDLPGAGEPSFGLMALLAVAVLALTALVIYRRGQWAL